MSRRSLAFDDLHKLRYADLVSVAKSFNIEIAKKKDKLIANLRPHVIAGTVTQNKVEKILNIASWDEYMTESRRPAATKAARRAARSEAPRKRRRARSGTYTLDEPSPQVPRKSIPVIAGLPEDENSESDVDHIDEGVKPDKESVSCSPSDSRPASSPSIDDVFTSGGEAEAGMETDVVHVVFDDSVDPKRSAAKRRTSDERRRQEIEEELARRMAARPDAGDYTQKTATPEFMRYLKQSNASENKTDHKGRKLDVPDFGKIHQKIKIDSIVDSHARLEKKKEEVRKIQISAARPTKASAARQTPKMAKPPTRKSPRLRAHSADRPPLPKLVASDDEPRIKRQRLQNDERGQPAAAKPPLPLVPKPSVPMTTAQPQPVAELKFDFKRTLAPPSLEPVRSPKVMVFKGASRVHSSIKGSTKKHRKAYVHPPPASATSSSCHERKHPPLPFPGGGTVRYQPHRGPLKPFVDTSKVPLSVPLNEMATDLGCCGHAPTKSARIGVKERRFEVKETARERVLGHARNRREMRAKQTSIKRSRPRWH